MNQELNRFNRYFALYEKLVIANARNFVDGRFAEDVSQETFEKMFKHLPYLEDERVKGWLIVVSGNIAKDYHRKSGTSEIYCADPMEALEEMNRYSPSAEQVFEYNEKKKADLKYVWTACNVLYEKNPIWYEVIVDCCMLDMSSAEIAKILQITTVNVDVIKCRARKYLKKVMKTDYRELF